MVGFWSALVKPLGPVQLNTVPMFVVVFSCSVDPAHTGPLLEALAVGIGWVLLVEHHLLRGRHCRLRARGARRCGRGLLTSRLDPVRATGVSKSRDVVRAVSDLESVSMGRATVRASHRLANQVKTHLRFLFCVLTTLTLVGHRF